MLCFFTTLAIGHLPPFDIYLRVVHSRTSSNRGGLPCAAESPCRDSQCDFVCVGSGIHSAIHGKIRPGDVRGLRTGDKRHHRGELVHTPVTIEPSAGLLRHRPLPQPAISTPSSRTPPPLSPRPP